MSLLSSSSLNKTQDTLAKIDGILTAIEKYPDNSCQNLTVDLNPFALLLLFLKMFGVTKEEMIQWFVKLLKYELPTIELGMKGIILSHLKQMVDCSIDPRIPIWARDNYMETTNGDCSGMTFQLSAIDCMNKLSTNPFSVPKNPLFFGVTEDDIPYDMLRAKDFDAFLWLLIHKKFPNSTRISGLKNSLEELKFKYNASSYSGYGLTPLSLLDAVKLIYDPNENPHVGILPGASFKEYLDNNGNTRNSISVCKNAKRDNNGNIISNEIFPIGAYYDRLTWYVNRKHYFDFMLPNSESELNDTRDYNEDIGLCSFKYIDDITDNALGDDNCSYIKNKINVKILPKPLIHYPRLGQKILLPIKILFNSKGEPDKNGYFTVKVETKQSKGYAAPYMSYKIVNENKQSAILEVDGDGAYKITETKGVPAASFLYECYPNLTIYEFNYDYIFGIKLLDAKVVATQLLNAVANLNLGFNVQMSSSYYDKERITKIVKKIVEANDYESSDCFFSFSNEEVDSMTRDSEIQRSKNIPFGNKSTNITQDDIDKISELLNEFSESPTLEKSTDTMSRLMEQVSVTIENKEDRTEEKFSFNTSLSTDFIEEILKNLTSILIDAILTPKIILMLSINKKLCGQYNTDDYNIEMLLNQMQGLITSMVKEIRDLILQKLLDFVMEKITKLLIDLNGKLLLEQLMVYRGIIKRLISDCFSWGGGSLLSTTLDNVDYADIDDTNKQPKTNKC